MSSESYVSRDQTRDIIILISTLHGYSMCEYRFALVATYDKALHDPQVLSCLLDLLVSVGSLRILVTKLLARLEPSTGDIPIIYSDTWNIVWAPNMAATLLA